MDEGQYATVVQIDTDLYSYLVDIAFRTNISQMAACHRNHP